MSRDPWMSGVAENDAEESRSAARFDTTWYRRIGTELIDEDLIPALSDLDWGVA